MTVKVTFDEPKMRNAMKLALYATKNEILEDCRFYAREDTGAMIDSAKAEDDPNGEASVTISFNTPYAERVYFEGLPSKDKNPNASLKWCHVAADAHLDEWITHWGERVIKALGD